MNRWKPGEPLEARLLAKVRQAGMTNLTFEHWKYMIQGTACDVTPEDVSQMLARRRHKPSPYRSIDAPWEATE